MVLPLGYRTLQASLGENIQDASSHTCLVPWCSSMQLLSPAEVWACTSLRPLYGLSSEGHWTSYTVAGSQDQDHRSGNVSTP